MWNPFKKYKMKIKELQQENEGLNAQIAGLAFNLRQSDEKLIMFMQTLQAYKEKVKELEDEIRLLRMSNIAAKKYSDSERNY
jgi:septal ring factor EnvC (AmiA/AmiB activator)